MCDWQNYVHDLERIMTTRVAELEELRQQKVYQQSNNHHLKNSLMQVENDKLELNQQLATQINLNGRLQSQLVDIPFQDEQSENVEVVKSLQHKCKNNKTWLTQQIKEHLQDMTSVWATIGTYYLKDEEITNEKYKELQLQNCTCQDLEKKINRIQLQKQTNVDKTSQIQDKIKHQNELLIQLNSSNSEVQDLLKNYVKDTKQVEQTSVLEKEKSAMQAAQLTNKERIDSLVDSNNRLKEESNMLQKQLEAAKKHLELLQDTSFNTY
eukprot:TRINITY_DN8461_c1_g1_i1.p1 TRINITY_DN8461_c1_g1~~TRINITY_DN8461_c1_g1_i1.p1  ORF type:complete len:267 (-),score=16.10 TRINITY_DN8461_c1_g1_i1:208-1008(-)